MIDISKALALQARRYQRLPTTRSWILHPLYQREYSWDKENIDQLIEDICRGVLIEDKTIRFLGQLFLSQNAILSIYERVTALPPRIDNVIDGATHLDNRLYLLPTLPTTVSNKEKVPNSSDYGGIEETVNSYLETL